jgi:hypothetical protein
MSYPAPKAHHGKTWTEREDRVIIRLWPSCGRQWKLYRPHLPDRCGDSIRGRAKLLLKWGMLDGQVDHPEEVGDLDFVMPTRAEFEEELKILEDLT